MWPRIVQVMLGLWLVLSPLIFRLERKETVLTTVPMASGAAVVLLALTAIRVRFLHLATIAVGLWLMAYGYLASGYPPAPAYRNLLVIGALPSLLGSVPTDCLQPTRSWREYYRGRAEGRRAHGG